MSRHYQLLFQGDFSSGWTDTVAGVLRRNAPGRDVVRADDIILEADGFVYPRGNFRKLLSITEPIEFVKAFTQVDRPNVVMVVTPLYVMFYDMDHHGNLTLKHQVSRASRLPVTATMYQNDVFFTLDGELWFYDPETEVSFRAGLDRPDKPSVTTEGEADLRGTYSYVLVYVRQVGSRQEVESVASESASVEVNGEGVRLNFSAAPTGLGITATRIYRARVDADVTRPYLHVADVDPTVTTYLDTTPMAELGDALYTLGVKLPGAHAVEVFLDHLCVAYNDRVYISAPYRPETFEPGMDLALDEGMPTTGDIRLLVRGQDRLLAVKRDAVYDIVPTGTKEFMRALISDRLGTDSPYGATTVTGSQILLATPWTVYLAGQSILRGLEPKYRQLPPSTKEALVLGYYADHQMTFLCLHQEGWVMTRGAWSRWWLPMTSQTEVKQSGLNAVLIGRSDGRIELYEPTNRKNRRGICRAVHVLGGAGSVDVIPRVIKLRLKGHGRVGVRVVSLDYRIESPWYWYKIDEDDVTTRTTPVYSRGRTIGVDVVLEGNVGIGGYEVWGRTGRQSPSSREGE